LSSSLLSFGGGMRHPHESDKSLKPALAHVNREW